MAPKRYQDFLLLCLRVLSDVVSVLGAYAAALTVSLPAGTAWADHARSNLLYLLVFLVVWLGTAADQRLFVARRSEALVSLLFSVAKALFGAALFSAFVIELLEPFGLRRQVFIPLVVVALCLILVTRLLTGISLWNLRRRGYNHRRILVIGANERSAHLASVLLANEQYGYVIEGFLEDDASRRPILEQRGLKYLGRVENLEHMLVNSVLDAVYISLPVRSFYEQIQSIAHLCEGVGVPVRFLADLFPLRMATSQVTRLADVPLLSLSFEREVQAAFTLRRIIDVLAALLLVAVLSPFLVVIALLVAVDQRGRVFAWRKGHGGVTTLMFRTAAHGQEEDAEVVQRTLLGRFLERYGLDELPQLFMVLTGRDSLSPAYTVPGATSKRDSSA